MSKARLTFVESNELLVAYYQGHEIAVINVTDITQEQKQQFCNSVACCVYRVNIRNEIRLCATRTRSISTTPQDL